MGDLILLRHGETDWELVNAHGWPGAANDLAPLTASGVRQAGAAAEALSGRSVDRVLTSPMTRAMASVMSFSRAPVVVAPASIPP